MHLSIAAALPNPGPMDSATRLTLWAAGACALLAWLMPTHELPWPAFHAELAMALAAVLGSLGVLHVLRGQAVTIPALAIVISIVATTPLLQFAAGTVRFAGDAALSSLYLFSFAVMVVMGHHAARLWSGRRVLEACAWTVLLASIASSGMALAQWLLQDDLPLLVNRLAPLARPYANLLQPNLLATLLVLGLLSIACLFDGRRIGAVASLLATGLLGCGLALAQSRAAWLELAVLTVLVIGRRCALTGRLGWRHLAAGAALLVLTGLAWTVLDPLSNQSVARDAADTANSTGNRLTHWREMVEAVLQHPWSGHGWMGVTAAQYTVAAGFPATHETMGYSHNLILDLLVWIGVPVGLAITFWLGAWLWRVARNTTESSSLLALAAVTALVVHAQVEYPLAYTYFLLPVGVLCGLLSASTFPAPVRAIPVWLSLLLLSGAAAVLAVVALDYLTFEQQLRRLRFDQARIGLDTPRPASVPIRLLTQLDAMLRFAQTPERENMTEAELDEMRGTVARFPSGANMVRLAAALAINHRPDEAVQVLQRVCKLESEVGCRNMEGLWTALGDRRPAIRQVAWPRP